MALHELTKAALRWKRDVADDEANSENQEPADAAEWQKRVDGIEAALAADSLAGNAEAADALMDYIAGDTTPAERRALNADLARGGHLERETPGAVFLGGRPRTVTVDGVRYYSAV